MAPHVTLSILLLGCVVGLLTGTPTDGQSAKEEWPKLLHILPGWSSGLVFSPDGKSLYAGGYDPDQPPPDRTRAPDRVINVWDVATGKQAATLRGHKVVRALALRPDGKFLASAGTGIRAWDVASGKVLAALEIEKDTIAGLVAFSPDGKVLAVASLAAPQRGDRGRLKSTIKLWSLDHGK